MDWFKRIKDLENITKIQCSNGNWDYDPYMMGLANGLILAHHMFTTDDSDISSPPFKSAPSKWLKDVPPTGLPATAGWFEKTPDAVYIGDMDDGEGNTLPLYNIIKKDHPQFGSTVSSKTLEQLGLKVPEKILPPTQASASEIVNLQECLKELVDVIGLENISNADDVVKSMNGVNHRASWIIKRADVDKFLNIVSKIVKRKNKYCVVSEKNGKNLGCSSTKEQAVKRLRQVEWFKHHK